MAKGSVLVVDDERDMQVVLENVLTSAGYEVRTAASAQQALEAYGQRRADLCIVDLQMPDRNGMSLLTDVRAADPMAQVVVLTAHGTIERAVQAIRAGAIDFLTKPVSRDVLVACVERVLTMEALRTENRNLRAEVAEKYDFDKLESRSPRMRDILALARRAAKRDVTVLITGESGVGKEVLARAIHYDSGRRAGPFFALNCAAIPENLVESEMFGYEKGAFSGADGARRVSSRTVGTGPRRLGAASLLPSRGREGPTPTRGESFSLRRSIT